MKKKLVTAAALASAATGAGADAGAFVGVTYAIGDKNGVGVTAQATSTRKEDHAIAAVGVSFFPFAPSPTVGIPVGVGYQGTHAAGVVSYDLLLKGVAVSGGYVNTRDDKTAAPPPPP